MTQYFAVDVTGKETFEPGVHYAEIDPTCNVIVLVNGHSQLQLVFTEDNSFRLFHFESYGLREIRPVANIRYAPFSPYTPLVFSFQYSTELMYTTFNAACFDSVNQPIFELGRHNPSDAGRVTCIAVAPAFPHKRESSQAHTAKTMIHSGLILSGGYNGVVIAWDGAEQLTLIDRAAVRAPSHAPIRWQSKLHRCSPVVGFAFVGDDETNTSWTSVRSRVVPPSILVELDDGTIHILDYDTGSPRSSFELMPIPRNVVHSQAIQIRTVTHTIPSSCSAPSTLDASHPQVSATLAATITQSGRLLIWHVVPLVSGSVELQLLATLQDRVQDTVTAFSINKSMVVIGTSIGYVTLYSYDVLWKEPGGTTTPTVATPGEVQFSHLSTYAMGASLSLCDCQMGRGDLVLCTTQGQVWRWPVVLSRSFVQSDKVNNQGDATHVANHDTSTSKIETTDNPRDEQEVGIDSEWPEIPEGHYNTRLSDLPQNFSHPHFVRMNDTQAIPIEDSESHPHFPSTQNEGNALDETRDDDGVINEMTRDDVTPIQNQREDSNDSCTTLGSFQGSGDRGIQGMEMLDESGEADPHPRRSERSSSNGSNGVASKRHHVTNRDPWRHVERIQYPSRASLSKEHAERIVSYEAHVREAMEPDVRIERLRFEANSLNSGVSFHPHHTSGRCVPPVQSSSSTLLDQRLVEENHSQAPRIIKLQKPLDSGVRKKGTNEPPPDVENPLRRGTSQDILITPEVWESYELRHPIRGQRYGQHEQIFSYEELPTLEVSNETSGVSGKMVDDYAPLSSATGIHHNAALRKRGPPSSVHPVWKQRQELYRPQRRSLQVEAILSETPHKHTPNDQGLYGLMTQTEPGHGTNVKKGNGTYIDEYLETALETLMG